ncbi:MAG TPA: adenylate/guanylate cyclase domain-containing protein [Solirubrobacteraceae bacterium]
MRGTHSQRRNVVGLVMVAILAGGIGVAAYATHLLRRSELQTIDARFTIRGTRRPPSNIVFVAISVQAERELKERHLESRSPLPRRFDAEVLDRLRRAGAKAIAMDMEFTQETNPTEDNELIEAVGRAHGKIVLGTVNVAVKPPGETEIFGGNSLLREIGARPAEVRLTLDSDGVVRRFDRSYNHLGSFPLAAAEVMLGHSIPASTFEGDGSLPIDFAGPPETFRSISYAKVMRGDFPAGLFQGALVIVGASSPILQDIHATSTTGGVDMAGPEIWANAAATLLQRVPLRFAPSSVDILVILLLGIAVPLGSLRLRQWRSMLNALALAVTFTVAVQVIFDRGAIVTFVYPLLALAVGTLGTLAVLYVGETIERTRVHDLFSRFVPADVVEQVVASAGENLRLGAVERDCTVLFSDLRGFTSFSEKLPATRVIEVVNCYLNEMTEAILAAGGTLISYMGDGIMAVFGAPLEQPDHADRALSAATEMIGARLDAFNAWIAENGHDHAFVMGVGINSGPVMAGNIGSEKRVEYTALGDTTNTASRLEGMTKGSGHMLFIADSTRQRMRRAPQNLVLVGELEVRGRVEPVPVWTIVEPGESSAPVGHVAAEDAPTGPAGAS